MTEPSEQDQIERILGESRTVAVVGLSGNPERPSYNVAAHLQTHGYRIIPVNPGLSDVLGEKAYPDLLAIPYHVDVVDIFRRSEAVPPIADQAIAIGAKAIWMQEGVRNEAAARKARAAGLLVVMDRCMLKESKRLIKAGRLQERRPDAYDVTGSRAHSV